MWRWIVPILVGAATWMLIGPALALPDFREYQRPVPPRLRFAASNGTITLHEPTSSPRADSFFEAPDRAHREADGAEVETVSKEELTVVLGERVAPYFAGRSGELRIDVTLLALEGRNELPESRLPHTSTATVEVRVQSPGGRDLVVTRGISAVQGHLGAMDAGVRKSLSAAIIDAFERAVLRDEFIRATNEALAERAPESTLREPLPVTRSLPTVENAWRVDHHSATASAHVASLVFDAGSAYSLGLRYLHEHVALEQGFVFGGYGAEARLFSNGGLDGFAALAVGRGGVAFEQALTLEVGAGVMGSGERASGLVIAGAFYSLYLMDLGVSFQIPFAVPERPDWISTVNFGLRIYVPFARSSLHVTRGSPLPLYSEILPWGYPKGGTNLFDRRGP